MPSSRRAGPDPAPSPTSANAAGARRGIWTSELFADDGRYAVPRPRLRRARARSDLSWTPGSARTRACGAHLDRDRKGRLPAELEDAGSTRRGRARADQPRARRPSRLECHRGHSRPTVPERPLLINRADWELMASSDRRGGPGDLRGGLSNRSTRGRPRLSDDHAEVTSGAAPSCTPPGTRPGTRCS